MNDIFSLAGKTALVAGASRGLGLAIAQQIADAGAHTILAARSLDKLEAHVKDLTAKGLSASAVRLDVADSKSIDAALAGLGDIDILLNVAGMNIRKRFQDYTRQDYDTMLQNNLTGLVELTQKVGAKMIARGAGGKVIFIGSLVNSLGMPYLSIYAITKGALANLSKVLAAEWGKYNIQVNTIAPGFILTDLNRSMWQDPKMNAWRLGNGANPNFGNPQDVAALATFLSGRGANYITGQMIAVDGGHSSTTIWPFEP